MVVFVYTACPWKPDKRMKKLWESIDKNGLVVEFAKQDQRDLIAWLTRHFFRPPEAHLHGALRLSHRHYGRDHDLPFGRN